MRIVNSRAVRYLIALAALTFVALAAGCTPVSNHPVAEPSSSVEGAEWAGDKLEVVAGAWQLLDGSYANDAIVVTERTEVSTAQPARSGQTIFIDPYDNSGAVYGTGTCSTFSGQITGNLRELRVHAIDRGGFCDASRGDAYLNSLNDVTQARLSSDHLILTGHTTRLRYERISSTDTGVELPPAGPRDLLGAWQLTTGSDAVGTFGYDGRKPRLQFEPGHLVEGNDGCNSFNARRTGGPGTITLRIGVTTAIACVSTIVNEQSSRYTDALTHATHVYRDGARMILTGPDIWLEFYRAENG